jgi:hypothetical protein
MGLPFWVRARNNRDRFGSIYRLGYDEERKGYAMEISE